MRKAHRLKSTGTGIQGLVMVPFLLFVAGCFPPRAEREVEPYDMAKDWYRAQKYDQAIGMCHAALSENPDHLDAWILLGACHRNRSTQFLNNGDRASSDQSGQQATFAYRKALDQAPSARQSEIYYELGLLFYGWATTFNKEVLNDKERQDCRDKAIGHFRDALRTNYEKGYLVHRYLGTLLAARSDKGDLQEALKHYQDFLVTTRKSLEIEKYVYKREEKMMGEEEKTQRFQIIQEHELDIKTIEETVRVIEEELKKNP